MVDGDGAHKRAAREKFDLQPLVDGRCPMHGAKKSLRLRVYPSLKRRLWQCGECGRQAMGTKSEVAAWVSAGRPVEPWDFDLEARERARFLAVLHPATLARRDALREGWFRDHGEYLATAEWAALRDAVVARDQGACTGCGARGTQVHHLTYARWRHEDLDDLTLLCGACHEKEHRETRETPRED